jgi:hypothetical protein
MASGFWAQRLADHDQLFSSQRSGAPRKRPRLPLETPCSNALVRVEGIEPSQDAGSEPAALPIELHPNVSGPERTRTSTVQIKSLVCYR